MVDRLSGLPEAIVHHIMSFLPMADTIKTSSLSKTFLSVLSGYPMMVFNYGYHHYHSHFHGNSQIECYLRDVDSTIQNHKKDIQLEKFRIQVPLVSIRPDARIHRAISFATRKGVKGLDIDCGFSDEFYLSTSQRAIQYPLPLYAMICRKCPNPITTLHLRGLDIRGLPELALGCPNIRTLTICYCTVSPGHVIVKIYLPKLKNFTHRGRAHRVASYLSGCEVVFDLSSCTSLNLVSLDNAKGVDDLWMEKHVSKLRLLETLELVDCRELEGLKISGHDNLKTVKLKGCDRLKTTEHRSTQHILNL